MRKFLLPLVCCLSSPSLAQTASVQDQLLSVCGNINLSLAKQLDAANARIEALQKQISEKKPEPEKESK